MTTQRERELAERLRQRDGDALGPYIELRRPHLMAYIDRRIGAALRAKVEPEDILQEVGASAVKALPGYDMGDRDPFGWLCTLADRRIVDAHRRHFEAEKRAAGREAGQERLYAAIAKLPPEAQDALRMRYGRGMPSKEIAAELGKSDGAVRVMLTRSLDKLLALMGEDDAPRG